MDIAFVPQVNEFRGERAVQMNISDIRPSCHAECSCETESYRALRNGTLTPQQAASLLPDRATLGMVWRYLSGLGKDTLKESPICLCRKIVRWSGISLDLAQLLTCLDIFSDVGLLKKQHLHKHISLRLVPRQGKADLTQSQTMQRLIAVKES